jgi:hypothetical protein
VERVPQVNKEPPEIWEKVCPPLTAWGVLDIEVPPLPSWPLDPAPARQQQLVSLLPVDLTQRCR